MVLAVPTFPQQSAQLEGFDLFEQANTAYIRFARWLKQQQECLSKKAFKELLQSYGMVRREATKLIKLATASDRFVAEDLSKLGTMMFSLLTPRYEPLWSEMLDQGELTQDVVDGLKKQMFPAQKREKNEPSIWRQPKGVSSGLKISPALINSATGNEGISISPRRLGLFFAPYPRGGTRYCQIPPIHEGRRQEKEEGFVEISRRPTDGSGGFKPSSFSQAKCDDQETGVRLQRIISSEGITAQKAVESALECYEGLTRNFRGQASEKDNSSGQLNKPNTSLPPKVGDNANEALTEGRLAWVESKDGETVAEVAEVETYALAPEVQPEVDSVAVVVDVETPESVVEVENANDWCEVERLLERSHQNLENLIASNTPELWSILQEQLIKYLSVNDGEALRNHDVDWVPLSLLEKVMKCLSFEVADASGGLGATKWVKGCLFAEVTDFGKDDDEVWKFTNPEGETVNAWAREDIKITAF